MTDIGDVTSTTNNIGDWADFELAFLVPVKRERYSAPDAKPELCGVGLVPAFTFVDNTIAAAARSEVLGIPTTRATFVKPQNVWMDGAGTASGGGQQLLEMHAEVLPVIGEGQRSEMRRLVQINQGVPGTNVAEETWRVDAESWCALLRQELGRKKSVEANPEKNESLLNLQALALELLGNSRPFALYTMKQFRDVADPDRACYQSVVRVPRRLTKVYDVREIEEPLTVRLHEFPTQPIVETLGLIGQNVSATGTAIAWELQPVRPFTLRVTMEEGLGERLLYHPGDGVWKIKGQDDDDPNESYLDEQANISVGTLLVAYLDQGEPRRMAEVAYEFSLRPDLEQERLRLPDALKAIETIDPQLVVEMILSREWGNWDESSRRRRGRADLVARHGTTLAGISARRLPEAEEAFFGDALSQAGYQFKSWSYDTTRTVEDYAKKMIYNLKRLIELTADMDACWNQIYEYGVWQTVGPPPFLTRRPEEEIVGKILEGTRAFLAAIEAIKERTLVRDDLDSEMRREHRVGANESRSEEIETNEPVLGLKDTIAAALAGKASKVVALEQVWARRPVHPRAGHAGPRAKRNAARAAVHAPVRRVRQARLRGAARCCRVRARPSFPPGRVVGRGMVFGPGCTEDGRRMTPPVPGRPQPRLRCH